MNSITFDAELDDEQRRLHLYEGALLVYSPTPNSLELCHFAQELAADAFAPHDPEHAQEYLPVEKYVEILAELKPKFIHHPHCKELIRGMFEDVGCDIEKTYFDVPRLRTMTHGNYLTAGLAYAFHPHRDTWFSAPPSQLNWWLPVYDIGADNTIAFFPKYWSKSDRQQLAGIQLLQVEPGKPAGGRHTDQDGHAQAAAGFGADRHGFAGPSRLSRRAAS